MESRIELAKRSIKQEAEVAAKVADRIGDSLDNCPFVANADQANFDGDELGDVCDPDDDNDGALDENDAFPLDASETVDTDGDGSINQEEADAARRRMMQRFQGGGGAGGSGGN